MRRKFYRRLLPLLLCLLAFSGALWYAVNRPHGPAADTIGPPVDETVTVHGIAYHVGDGTVTRTDGKEPSAAERSAALGVATALAVAQRSPLLDLAGTDPVELRSAVQNLSSMQQKLAAEQTADGGAQLVDALYPISFLNALADLEAARKQFISSGSDADEAAYESKLSAAIAEGSKDIAAFKQAFDSVGHPTYALAAGIVKGEAIDKELQSISDGFSAIAQMAQRRSKCFAGNTGSCDQADLAVSLDVLTPAASSTDATGTPPLVEEAAGIMKTTSYAKNSPFGAQVSKLVKMDDSICTAVFSAPPYFLFNKYAYVAQLEFVGDLLFTTVTKQPEGGLFQNLGASYIYFDPLNYYTCLEDGHDIARAFAITETADYVGIHSSPISERTVLDALRGRLTATSPHELKEVLPYYLMFKDNSAGFAVIVHDIARIVERDFNEHAAGVKSTFTPDFLFSIKSGFHDLFLAHNPSAGSDATDIYAGSEKNPLVSSLVRLSALTATTPIQEIEKDVAAYMTYHKTPQAVAYAIPKNIPTTVLTPPPGKKLYQNNSYGFALFYPDNLSVSEQAGPGNSLTVLFKDQSKNQGFQVFVIPYGQPKITQERFLMDEPSGVMQQPLNMMVDGEAATKFFSTNQAMGATREVWFLHNALLYEVTAPQPLDSWLMNILSSWKFLDNP